ncbi:hypothetical protein AF335_08720 [Streptomyces eurocidicus]|uniref:Regulator component n=1 Tax=Streptomyces eurocidicus TaxID=66423 RepID=A0A2N8P0S3_STREU|nr:hypothetical protein [Streptomyces eurocidicus]MBB5122115.1 hypothetical protein [Streptomyces eurocidicus]MBF6055446.1 hypothetical protein [Streptomyces eurocidicus]PNE34617.1 hypothetical protein AF335_08720 [Streptomyces eurocidicus]
MITKYTQLHRRCQAVLDQLTLPRPFSIDALCRELSRTRGRPLHLHALPDQAAGGNICGLWLATPTDDHIFYEQRTTQIHQEHIILHEIGHMLFDHHGIRPTTPPPGVPTSTGSTRAPTADGARSATTGTMEESAPATTTAGENSGVQALLPDLSPQLIQRLLGRASYTTRQEQEAEMLATLLRIRASTLPETGTPQGVLGRLGAALGAPVTDVR